MENRMEQGGTRVIALLKGGRNGWKKCWVRAQRGITRWIREWNGGEQGKIRWNKVDKKVHWQGTG